MGRKAFIKALEDFKDAEYTQENESDLFYRLECANDGQLTSSECEDIAFAYLNMED